MDITVSVKGLTRKFGDFTAVDGISFEVKRGEIFGFLGPNGAGKSTTIKMLCGILLPTGGEGHVYGYDIVKGQDSIKNNIGYMSQRFSLYDDLTVQENLEFYGSIYGLGDEVLEERIKFAANMAGIGEARETVVRKLPLGIKQRLALGAAILHDPPVLFLDEPTSGVDPIMRRNFWELIYGFSRQGKTIFVTTHYMDEAEHCDRIALIIAGGIIALDSPHELKSGLPYSVYSLQVERFIEVFDRINSLDSVKESAIFGSDIHILCGKEVRLAREIKPVLKELGIGHFRLSRISPTLEDVFVTSAKKHGL